MAHIASMELAPAMAARCHALSVMTCNPHGLHAHTSASWYQLLHRFGYSQLGRLRDCLARGIDLPPDAVMPSPEVQLLAFYLDCR